MHGRSRIAIDPGGGGRGKGQEGGKTRATGARFGESVHCLSCVCGPLLLLFFSCRSCELFRVVLFGVCSVLSLRRWRRNVFVFMCMKKKGAFGSFGTLYLCVVVASSVSASCRVCIVVRGVTTVLLFLFGSLLVFLETLCAFLLCRRRGSNDRG